MTDKRALFYDPDNEILESIVVKLSWKVIHSSGNTRLFILQNIKTVGGEGDLKRFDERL